MFHTSSQILVSSWSKNDTLVASGGEDTGVAIWDPFKQQNKPLYLLKQAGTVLDIAWKNDT